MIFKYVTLKHKILMMLVLEISALLLLFFVSQFFMQRNTTLLAHIETGFVPALEVGRDLEQMLTEIQRSMQDAVATTDQEALSSVDILHNEFLHLFEQGRTNPFFEAKKLDQLKADFQAYYALARKTSLQLIEGRSLDEELVGELGAMRERYNAIKTQLQSKTTQAKEEVSTSFSAALRNSQRSAIIMNLIILSFTLLFGGSSLLLSRSITEPLRNLVTATNRIAQGDLTQKIVIRTGAELAILGTAMERMRSELYQFYQKLEQLVAERTQALQESEARFRQVISSISDHIYTGELTEEGEWITRYHSPNVETLTGYPPEKFLEDSYLWPSLIYPNDKSGVDVQLAHFLKGQNSEVEYRLTRKDGEIIWVRDSGRVEIQAGQKNKIIYGVVSDISQRKQAEEERLRLETRLQQAQKLEAIGKLAGGAAHEFNNILAILLGTIELIMDDLPEDSPEKARLEQAYKIGERGQALVQQILIFSRSSHQALQPMRLVPILQNAIKMAHHLLPSSVKLQSRLEPDCPPVLTNPIHIEQIVINLCKNAVQAMAEQGGNVEITLEGIDSSAVPNYPELPKGRYARLTVRDDGSGMPPEVRHRIFDPFFTTREIGKGTGLGLSVVHGIVQQHGGGIRVASEPGKGTTFEILFPVVQEIPQLKSPLATSPEQDPKDHRQLGVREHILLVNANLQFFRLPLMALEKLGYRVTITRTSREALHQVQTDPQQFDLVIMDSMMPEISGLDLCRKLRQLRPDLPMIMFLEPEESVEFRPGDRIGSLKLLRKPVNIRQLTQTLREVLLESPHN